MQLHLCTSWPTQFLLALARATWNLLHPSDKALFFGEGQIISFPGLLWTVIFFFFLFFFPPLWMRPMTALCDVLHKCQIPEQDWHSGIQVIYTPNIFILYCIISLNWKFHVWKIFCCCIYKHRFEIIDGIDFNKRKTKFQTFTLPVDTHLMNLIWKGLLNAVISLTVF